jgi:hypothetical protein
MKLETQIRSAIRDVWMKSTPRKEAFIRSRIPCGDGSRRKWLETCEMCGKTAYIGEKEHKTKKDGTPSKVKRPVLVCHHIDEVPHVYHPDFIKMMFCAKERLQILCNPCHDAEHGK